MMDQTGSNSSNNPGSNEFYAPGALEQQKLVRNVNQFIASTPWLPQGVDWRPFCEALAQIRPLAPKQKRAEGRSKTTRPGRRPSAGSKNESDSDTYVHYVPSWTDPDHIRAHQIMYNDVGFKRQTIDPLSALRPALREEDAVKRPTPWAKRWGTHPATTTGRSCLSPLMGCHRSQLEQHLPKDLVEHIMIGTNERHIPLEQLLSEPNTVRLIEDEEQVKYLNRALREQDYQRAMFDGLTKDEMLQGKVQTMSNDEVSDLQGLLHPLVDRQKWDNQEYRGAESKWPRYVYSLNGERRLWDPTTNDSLWEALQPALQLVSRVLEREPPFWQSLMDMRTRQILPADEHPKGDNNPPACAIVDLSKVDMTKCPRPIQQLARAGYNWADVTKRLLREHLSLAIGTGWQDSESGEDRKCLVYGITEDLTRDGGEPEFLITLSADLIWPLLVPDYSSSEKLTVSFLLAASILHELAHAVNLAHWQHTSEARTRQQKARRRGEVTDEITDHLVATRREVLDGMQKDEPWDRDTGHSELGFAFEWSLFGSIIITQWSQDSRNGASRDTRFVPLVLTSSNSVADYHCCDPDKRLKGKGLPFETYHRAVPTDYVSKFFTEKFWAEDFGQYGWEALKMWPDTRWHKVSFRERYRNIEGLKAIWGEADYEKFTAIWQLLSDHGYPILAEYLHHSAGELVRPQTLYKKWMHDLGQWKRKEDPLPEDLRCLAGHFHQALDANGKLAATTRGDLGDYLTAMVESPPGIESLSLQEYQDRLARTWMQSISEGGETMRWLSRTFRHMREDIEVLQRIAFDFLMLDHPDRVSFVTNESSSASPGRDTSIISFVLYTCDSRKRRVEEIVRNCVTVTKLTAAGDTHEGSWKSINQAWEAWAQKFGIFGRAYTVMAQLLRNEGKLDRHMPRAHVWMSQFETIPSSAWKTRAERLRDLANDQVPKLDPRIGEHVRYCGDLIARSRVGGRPIFDVDAGGSSSARSIERLMAEMKTTSEMSEGDSAWVGDIIPTPFSLPRVVRDMQREQVRGGGGGFSASSPGAGTRMTSSITASPAAPVIEANANLTVSNSMDDLSREEASIQSRSDMIFQAHNSRPPPPPPQIPSSSSGFSRYATTASPWSSQGGGGDDRLNLGASFGANSLDAVVVGRGGERPTIPWGSSGTFEKGEGEEKQRGEGFPRPFPDPWAGANLFQGKKKPPVEDDEEGEEEEEEEEEEEDVSMEDA